MDFNWRVLGVSIIAAAALLQACAPSVPEYFQDVDVLATQAAVQAPQACNARTLQWMIGQSQSVVASVKIAGPVRIIGVNQAITMDNDPTRTNFRLDVAGKVTQVTCG